MAYIFAADSMGQSSFNFLWSAPKDATFLEQNALDGYGSGFRIGGRCITNLRYADDIVLIASSEEELREMVNRLHEGATEMGMKINERKTEVMKVSDDPNPTVITVAGTTLKGLNRSNIWVLSSTLRRRVTKR